MQFTSRPLLAYALKMMGHDIGEIAHLLSADEHTAEDWVRTVGVDVTLSSGYGASVQAFVNGRERRKIDAWLGERDNPAVDEPEYQKSWTRSELERLSVPRIRELACDAGITEYLSLRVGRLIEMLTTPAGLLDEVYWRRPNGESLTSADIEASMEGYKDLQAKIDKLADWLIDNVADDDIEDDDDDWVDLAIRLLTKERLVDYEEAVAKSVADMALPLSDTTAALRQAWMAGVEFVSGPEFAGRSYLTGFTAWLMKNPRLSTSPQPDPVKVLTKVLGDGIIEASDDILRRFTEAWQTLTWSAPPSEADLEAMASGSGRFSTAGPLTQSVPRSATGAASLMRSSTYCADEIVGMLRAMIGKALGQDYTKSYERWATEIIAAVRRFEPPMSAKMLKLNELWSGEYDSWELTITGISKAMFVIDLNSGSQSDSTHHTNHTEWSWSIHAETLDGAVDEALEFVEALAYIHAINEED